VVSTIRTGSFRFRGVDEGGADDRRARCGGFELGFVEGSVSAGVTRVDSKAWRTIAGSLHTSVIAPAVHRLAGWRDACQIPIAARASDRTAMDSALGLSRGRYHPTHRPTASRR